MQAHRLISSEALFSPLTYGPPSTPSGAHDYQLGQRLGGLIAQQAASKLPFSAVFSQLQDLLGADTSMLGPLRDLLGKPAFGQLVGTNQRSVMVGARDALLQEFQLGQPECGSA
jgi:hypothetical protein